MVIHWRLRVSNKNFRNNFSIFWDKRCQSFCRATFCRSAQPSAPWSLFMSTATWTVSAVKTTLEVTFRKKYDSRIGLDVKNQGIRITAACFWGIANLLSFCSCLAKSIFIYQGTTYTHASPFSNHHYIFLEDILLFITVSLVSMLLGSPLKYPEKWVKI